MTANVSQGLHVGATVAHEYPVDPKFIGVAEVVPGSTAPKARVVGKVESVLADGGLLIRVTESNHQDYPVGSEYPLASRPAASIQVLA